MSSQKDLTFTDVQIKGPYEGKYGQFDIHIYIDEEGNTYTENANSGADPRLSLNQVHNVIFDTKDSIYGPKNYIKKPKKAGNTLPWGGRGTKEKLAKTNTYDSKGARNGMLVKASVDLGIARKTTKLEALKEIADELLELAQYVETKE